ncbi:MAG: hypothetical protein IJ391_06725 [Clostridia bacterium]|nr:hypothetical protein [Clostridia bacterium]
MRSRAKTQKIALGAMLAALGVVLQYFGAVIEVLDLTCCAAASLIIVFAVIEFGRKYAYGVYAATLILSAILVPNKFEVAAYAFVALYVIIKSNIERLKRVSSWILKLLYFNIVLALALTLAKLVFMTPDLDLMAVVFFEVVGNVAFILFDIAVTKLIILYIYRLRARFKIDRYVAKLR